MAVGWPSDGSQVSVKQKLVFGSIQCWSDGHPTDREIQKASAREGTQPGAVGAQARCHRNTGGQPGAKKTHLFNYSLNSAFDFENRQ